MRACAAPRKDGPGTWISDEIIAGYTGLHKLGYAHSSELWLDGGHNPQGIAAVTESLEAHFPNRKITFLIGVMADKDIPHMIDSLAPLAKEFVTVTPDNPRALHADVLAAMLTERGLNAISLDNVKEGVRTAIELAGPSGIVCALGSLYLLGDVRKALGAN